MTTSYATWCIHIDMTHSHVPWLIHMCHDSFTCDTTRTNLEAIRGHDYFETPERGLLGRVSKPLLDSTHLNMSDWYHGTWLFLGIMGHDSFLAVSPNHCQIVLIWIWVTGIMGHDSFLAVSLIHCQPLLIHMEGIDAHHVTLGTSASVWFVTCLIRGVTH